MSVRKKWRTISKDLPLCKPSPIRASLYAWRHLGSLATHWVHSKDSDQTGWTPRLIWVFTGCKGHFVGSVMLRLNYNPAVPEIIDSKLRHCKSNINEIWASSWDYGIWEKLFVWENLCLWLYKISTGMQDENLRSMACIAEMEWMHSSVTIPTMTFKSISYTSLLWNYQAIQVWHF